MGITTRYVKSTGRLPVRVDFKCPKCGALNCNKEQALPVEAISNTTVFRSDETLKKQAHSRLEGAVEKAVEDVRQNNYQKYHFSCSCEECGEYPVWTAKPELKQWVFGAFVIGVMLIAIFILVLLFGRRGKPVSELLTNPGTLVTLPVAVLMCIPMIVYFVKNKKYLKKLSALPEDLVPHLSLLTDGEDKPENE